MAGSRRKEVGLVLTDESNIVDMRRIIPDLDNILQIAFLCLAVAIVLAQANPFYQFPNRDGGLFMYMGSQILDGKLLYVDIWGDIIFVPVDPIHYEEPFLKSRSESNTVEKQG